MNIDEAIKNFRYDAENNRADLDLEFAKENEQIAKWLAQLKEYQQLEEQGMLIKLPCKVGDTAYEITGATTHGYDWKYLTYEKAYVHGTVFNLGRLYDIGKTVFLTKSKAEAKLKELKGDINGK